MVCGALGALAMVPAVASADGPMSVEGESEHAPAIYGGEASATCAWPTTVFTGGCTGTLVHPRVVIYAAHCGTNINSIGLGESVNNLSRVVQTERCEANPDYGRRSGTDHAYCLLREPINDVPIVPPLMGCETDILQPGQEVTIVGFGQADAQPSSGVKREVVTTINAISPAGRTDEAFIGGDGKDSCFGDSGGPVYVDMGPDLGWRVFGITSYGLQQQCGPGGYYSMMHTAMDWFESRLEQDGIDITPCHTSDGTWDPGPECGFFPSAPGTPASGWGQSCGGGDTTAYVATCGAPFGDEEDLAAPLVSVTSPADGTRYDSGAEDTVSVTITADATDDGWGVRNVALALNGARLDGSEKTNPPYEWELSFPPGAFTITAIATDRADNEAISDEVGIGVDQDAPTPEPDPEPDPGGTTGGEGTTGGDGGGDSGTDSGGAGDSGAEDDASGDAGAESGGTGGGGAGAAEESSGCNVAGEGPAPIGLALLGLVGLGALRRRRA